jgi:hypothetical protein
MTKAKKTGRKLAKAAYHLSGASITLGATKAVAKAPLVAMYPLLPHKTPAPRRNHGRWS